MFNAYDFTYGKDENDFISAYELGLQIYDFGDRGQDEIAFGNKAEIIETRINRRIQPIHYGVNYHTEPLVFTLLFGAMEPIDRYTMQEVALWLDSGGEYKWLTIDQPDLADKQFRCIITELTPVHHGWLPVAFEATVTCDCPYAYSYPFEFEYNLTGSQDILFRNESTTREYLKPKLTFDMVSGEVSIINQDDNNREFKLSGIPASTKVYVENNSGIIRDERSEYNLYEGFNTHFFRLVQGDNLLTVNGNGRMMISGRYLYNVAG